MRRTRRPREGMTLVEIMVVVILMALIAAAVGVNVVGAMRQSMREDTKVRARTLQSVAVQWTLTNPSGACPTMRDLEPLLDATTDHHDAWDHPFTVRCDGGSIVVDSMGPDGRANTDDDIRMRDRIP